MCTNAIAVFKEKNVKGYVAFHQCEGQLYTIVDINLYDLKPNTVSAIHVHELGDITDGCMSLGGHWNPNKKNHGSIYIDVNNSHAGDLINNINSDNSGKFNFSYKDPRIRLRGNVNNSIIGRSVVIHEGKDDLGLGNFPDSLTTGHAGGRMACAVIGISK
jgi:Cu-Zn family superoxide dismutase